MTSSRKNKTIFIDLEATSALTLVKDNLLNPLTGLMGKEQSQELLKTGLINGQTFPFPFILAPAGKKNEQIISSLKKGEEVSLICEGKEFATLIVDETFQINPHDRTQQLYGTSDLLHPGVMSTIKRLGKWAVSGEYTIINHVPNQAIQIIQDAKNRIGAKHVSSIFMAANPLHRAHERLIRLSLDATDLLVIFLLKPNDNSNLSYDIRKESLEFFINNFLAKSKVVIVPLENSYIFAGYNEIIIDAIVAKNYGCDKIIIGSNHAGLGMFYDANAHKSIIDRVVGIDIDIQISSEYVYCNECTTLVSKETCPHGQHHQISYHSESILELLNLGILPPAVLMRKEISAFLLSKTLPNRFKNLEKLYYDLLPAGALLEEHSERDFYLELIKLYQTTSLT